jgi:L-malate glycosyltransferase
MHGGDASVGVAGPITLAPFRRHLEGAPSRLPSGLGGLPVTLLVEELLRRGHRVTISTLSRDVSEDVRFEGRQLRVFVGPYRRGGRARDAFRVERRSVTAGLRWGAPDVVHAHWAYEFALGALAAQRPTVVTLHDWAPTIIRYHRDAYRAVRCGMQAVTLARGRSLTAVSPYIASAAARWRRRARVIPNGLADEYFVPPDHHRVPDLRTPTFISVNTGFGERKNAPALLRAFALVRQRRSQARLRLIGSGYGTDELAHRWALANGLGEGVVFLGQQSYAGVLRELRRAEVLVHPSLEESFGMTLIEAAAQGTPVIAGRVSGAVPWVLAEGAGGVLTDVHEPEEIANAMLAMVDDHDRWQHWSRVGHHNAATRFRMSVVTDQYWSAYAHVHV